MRSGGGRWLPAAILTIAACGGGTRPPAQPPPQTPSTAEPAAPRPAEPAPAPPPAPAEPRAPAPRVVIEPTEPEPEEEAPTLAEAARRERERRQRAGAPIAVITDANLPEHAVGELTFIEDEPPAPAEEPGAETPDAGAPEEGYWRDRVREIRQRWADAAARVPELEERVAELRQRFYAADDAYYRDTRIKPAWDRAIDQIAQARAEAEAHRQELAEVLDEGRQAGALPGWLREGIELEPAPPEPRPEGLEPGEPTIVEPGEAGDG